MTDNTNAKMLAMQKEHGPLLEVKDLAIDFTTDTGKPVHAVRDANFTVYPGQWVAIVGESGSGKSTSAMAVLGLLPGTGHVVNGSIKLDGEEIAGAKQSEFDKLRGTKMGLVPQDPMSNLNPVWRIGTQVKEALKANNMDVAHEKALRPCQGSGRRRGRSQGQRRRDLPRRQGTARAHDRGQEGFD